MTQGCQNNQCVGQSTSLQAQAWQAEHVIKGEGWMRDNFCH